MGGAEDRAQDPDFLVTLCVRAYVRARVRANVRAGVRAHVGLCIIVIHGRIDLSRFYP